MDSVRVGVLRKLHGLIMGLLKKEQGEENISIESAEAFLSLAVEAGAIYVRRPRLKQKQLALFRLRPYGRIRPEYPDCIENLLEEVGTIVLDESEFSLLRHALGDCIHHAERCHEGQHHLLLDSAHTRLAVSSIASAAAEQMRLWVCPHCDRLAAEAVLDGHVVAYRWTMEKN